MPKLSPPPPKPKGFDRGDTTKSPPIYGNQPSRVGGPKREDVKATRNG